jgi:hypothetical protein
MKTFNIIIIFCIILLLIVWYNNTYKRENLTYTNNCYRTLDDEIDTVTRLNCGYCNSVAADENITNSYNERDKDTYFFHIDV